jgi:hypothetical protein
MAASHTSAGAPCSARIALCFFRTPRVTEGQAAYVVITGLHTVRSVEAAAIPLKHAWCGGRGWAWAKGAVALAGGLPISLPRRPLQTPTCARPAGHQRQQEEQGCNTLLQARCCRARHACCAGSRVRAGCRDCKPKRNRNRLLLASSKAKIDAWKLAARVATQSDTHGYPPGLARTTVLCSLSE